MTGGCVGFSQVIHKMACNKKDFRQDSRRQAFQFGFYSEALAKKVPHLNDRPAGILPSGFNSIYKK
jgi:hypothetical protein